MYERAGGVTTLVSQPSGVADPDTEDAEFGGASADGGRVFFNTPQKLTADDTDTDRHDVYERAGGVTTLVSQPSGIADDDTDGASFDGASADGGRVFFGTSQKLTADDSDSGLADVYERAGGVTTLVSQPSGIADPGTGHVGFFDASVGGNRVFFETPQSLNAADIDGARWDIYAAGSPDPPPPPPVPPAGGPPAGPGSPQSLPPRGLLPGACANETRGSRGPDVLDGSAAGDLLRGLAGNDRLNGLAGEDCLFGGAGKDRLSGGAGKDRLFGGAGKDRLSGGAGNDRLSGGTGNDTLTGGKGTNKISAGAGDDAVNSANRKRERDRLRQGQRHGARRQDRQARRLRAQPPNLSAPTSPAPAQSQRTTSLALPKRHADGCRPPRPVGRTTGVEVETTPSERNQHSPAARGTAASLSEWTSCISAHTDRAQIAHAAAWHGYAQSARRCCLYGSSSGTGSDRASADGRRSSITGCIASAPYDRAGGLSRSPSSPGSSRSTPPCG